jgi:hypothetical protein
MELYALRQGRKIMKKLTSIKGCALVTLIAFMLSWTAMVAGAAGNTLIVPKDKVFRIFILDTLDSGVNKNGDKVHFSTAADVMIDDVVIIPAGTEGTGSLDQVHPAGRWGKGGYFEISFGSIKTINGVDIPIEIGKAAQGAQKDSGVILPIAGIFFLPMALFGFTKGEEAHIDANTSVFVNTSKDVNLSITAAQVKSGKFPPAPAAVPKATPSPTPKPTK